MEECNKTNTYKISEKDCEIIMSKLEKLLKGDKNG